ncbi:MAG: GGDEF domain-containing protein [Ruminococcus sp.]|uniref:GGDEF domain-containing protein n=1 Tax=Ruminococcus sp. TaxID=41978 RepID=UPI001B289791|nr:GGDEF domain-containing protein [Ruminococcus sp.]MBO7472879.1 GGDEF domain-containing protein [Ruminococcus sp.]
MDFQAFVDTFSAMTCIISIEKFPDGHFGNIRLVAGNKAYVDSIEDPNNFVSNQMVSNKFIPDSPYENYIPKDLNFEDKCYRCAVLKKPSHEYIHPDRYTFWLDMYFMPLESNEPNKFYCSYSQQVTIKADSGIMSKLSADTSSAVLETCIKLRGTKNFKHTMDEVMNDIRSICDAKLSCILLTDEQERKCTVLCQSTAPEVHVIPMQDYIEKCFDNFYDIVETWKDTIAGSTCLIIKDKYDMGVLQERNPVWFDSLRGADVDSLVLFPLEYNDMLLGYIWAINFDINNTMRIKEILEITSFFLASEISNYQLFNKLEIMSSVDQLTGTYNRNAMNNRIIRFVSEKDPKPNCYSVVFADLNGLKQANDNNGHIAGDLLLKNAAHKLMEVFPECEIYRAGGDEFMIIAVDLPEQLITDRVEKLKKESEDPNNISFALGIFYDDKGEDIRVAMRTADERMYADKERYYAKFPERKRK